MKKYFKFLCFASILIMISCSKENSFIDTNDASDTRTSYIDFDFEKTVQGITNPTVRSASPRNLILLENATQRFWETVVYSNDSLQSIIKCGKDINISDRVYSGFIKQINDGNNFIRKTKEEGKVIILGLYNKNEFIKTRGSSYFGYNSTRPDYDTWTFNANQVINVTYSNSNILPAPFKVDVNHLYGTQAIYLAPHSSTTRRYDVFTQTPVFWKFIFSAGTDDSNVVIGANATWNNF